VTEHLTDDLVDQLTVGILLGQFAFDVDASPGGGDVDIADRVVTGVLVRRPPEPDTAALPGR
jgi:hypothetical protein